MMSFLEQQVRKFGVDRRQLTFLGLSGLAVGALPIGGDRAWSQSRVVVGTWGGEFEHAIAQSIGAPMQTLQGAEYVSDVGAAGARKARLMAERDRPVGSTDVICLDGFDMHLMANQNLLQPIDPALVPNLANVLPGFRRTYSVPLAFSGKVIVYNPARMPRPRSYADLWSKEYAGKIGFADLLAMYVIESAAQISGGSPTNYEPGKDKLKELKALGLKVFPSNEALAVALKSGDVWATIMWRARSHQWRKAGIEVDNVAPVEGATPITFEMAMARNAPHAAPASAFLNRALHPESQARFATMMGYSPTVAAASSYDESIKSLGFTDDERANFFKQDFDYLSKNQTQLLDWWAREIRT